MKTFEVLGFGPKRRDNPRAVHANEAINKRANKIIEQHQKEKTIDERLSKIEEDLLKIMEQLKKLSHDH